MKTKAKVIVKGKPVQNGERMTKGSEWTLTATKGTPRNFVGTLVGTINEGDLRLAIFKVPK